MNLESTVLKQVTRSRPEILRSHSKQSVAASDDFHSVSDYASSSSDDRTTAIRWTTPPSHTHSLEAVPDRPQSEATAVGRPSRRERVISPTPAIAEMDEASPSDRQAKLVQHAHSRTATDSETVPPSPGVDDTPYIRYAIEQITRNEVQQILVPRPTTASSVSTYPIDRIVPAEVSDPQPPGRNWRPHLESTKTPRQPAGPQLLIPVDPPQNSIRFPDLNFRPVILRPLGLAILALLCILMIAALIFCSVWSRNQSGLWNYTNAKGGRYFVCQFLPQILASIVVLYAFAVQTAVIRIMPFICLASRNVKHQSGALFLPLRPRTFLLPQLSHLRAGQAVIAGCMIILWLTIFTIPLQSSLFQVRLAKLGNKIEWRWVTVESIAWVLVVFYALLAGAVVTLMHYFLHKSTGLKWDPTTLSDLIVLLQRSNVLDQFEASETFSSQFEFRRKLGSGSSRLGYWKLAQGPDNLFYTLGEVGAPIRLYSLQRGKMKAQELDTRSKKSPDVRRKIQQSSHIPISEAKLLARVRSPLVRYRFIPWFLRDSAIITWIIIALVFLIAFIVVSFLHHAIRRGFRPLLSPVANKAGFSPPGFLYSFLPSLLGLFLFLFWQSVDMEFRALQPYASMSSRHGALAEHSILLDYSACLPVEVTVKAAVAKHWRVAWISFIGLLSITLPILGGGIFWAIYFPQDGEVRMVVPLPAFYALVVFFIVYCLSFLVIWPRRKRYLPHDTRSLAEIISFLYRSSLLCSPVFHEPITQTDLMTRCLGVPPGERELNRYVFGVYRGLDGNDHLGIDRLQRGVINGEEVV